MGWNTAISLFLKPPFPFRLYMRAQQQQVLWLKSFHGLKRGSSYMEIYEVHFARGKTRRSSSLLQGGYPYLFV